MSERLTSWKNDPYVCLKATVGRLSSTTTWLNIWSKIQAMLIFIARWYSGWWLTYPSEKYESQLGWLFPIYGNIKHVPNHQPVLDARKPLSFPRVSKNSLSQGCSKPPTSFQIPHETYGLWHQLPGSDLGRLRHWPRAKNLNDVTKVGGFPGWSWVAWWLKKIKLLRRFSQLFLVPDARYIMISGKIERKLWTIRMPGSGYFDRWMGTCLGKAPDRNTKTWENHGKLTLLGSKHVIPSYSVVVWCPNHCYPQLTSIWHEHFIGVSWNPWWSMCMEDVMAEQHAAKRI